MPSASITDDYDRSVEYDDDTIVSAAGPCYKAPEGATEVVVPPPWRSSIFKVPTTPTPPPRRSIRLRGEKALSVHLAAHPDYARYNISLVIDMMRD